MIVHEKKGIKLQHYFRLEILPHIYQNMQKSYIAQLCKYLSEEAHTGDLLCRWLFEEAGKQLAKHIIAVSHSAHQVTEIFYLGFNLVIFISSIKYFSSRLPSFFTFFFNLIGST